MFAYPRKLVPCHHIHKLLNPKSTRWLSFFYFPPTSLLSTRHLMTKAHVQVHNNLGNLRPVRNEDHGPVAEYNSRIATGSLRVDEIQQGVVRSLQALHDELLFYSIPVITNPVHEKPESYFTSLLARICVGLLSMRDERTSKSNLKPPPRGLYLYGDVGSGKTMLMDLFYETIPERISSKNRLHFHNFMQSVHSRLHKIRIEHGSQLDGITLLATEIAQKSTVLCFDEFQCTDVVDAMILRRLIEALISHGVILVVTSNRHPDDLYLNGIQRKSFIPCIDLLKSHLTVINLDSDIDYRKIPRPSSGVYHTTLDNNAILHAEKWFKYLGDPNQAAAHSEIKSVWGREIIAPRVSGRAVMFTFEELIGRPMSAADYIELTKSYDYFIVTNIQAMTFRERDLARRFITFVDAVYEARSILVLTSAVQLNELFLSKETYKSKKDNVEEQIRSADEVPIAESTRDLIDDLGLKMEDIKISSIFSGDEEKFAFARALSRLSEMGSQEWVERKLGTKKRKAI
ncbi:Protein AFG1 [Golovinomyces cichoracearum]|uniref:Protein AFG1 n=1 Tax=Golovinomyces cichoracearum TaxID=62708 RepID=A0A420IVI6_9PEZI|nr:Protein AFG1 [Golovinomyces cichoracearum]